MAKILVVEDDLDLAGLVKLWLSDEHHSVEVANDGADAMQLLTSFSFDLVVLDWDLPKLSGTEICRKLRAAGQQTLILMLTRKGDILDRETGLDAGADDYLVKPFHPRELSARIRALLRRQPLFVGDQLKAGHIVMDVKDHKVMLAGKEVKLMPLEFALLEFFMRNPNQYFTAEVLFEKVWPAESEATIAAVRTCIKEVRKKIDTGATTKLITNLHGVGYRLGTD